MVLPMLNFDQTETIIKVASRALKRKFFTVPGALRALEKAGYWGDQRAVEAIEQLKPFLEETIFHSRDDRLRQRAMGIIEDIFFVRQTVVSNIEFPKIGEDIYEVSYADLLRKTDIKDAKPYFANRSLVMEIDHESVLVVKLMRPEDSLENLANEILWMLYLKRLPFEERFVVPEPLAFEGSHILKLSNMPTRQPKQLKLHPHRYAIAFIVHKDYFVYPNGVKPSERLSPVGIGEVMTRCAYLLGKLTSIGVIHTSIIPLFHNRVQAKTRLDKGRYSWWQGHVGRLDRWLESCDWPNFGLSGIRDFEHFIPLSGSLQDLFHHIGEHLLGLFLVTGSYFRNQDRTKVGLDENKQPVDTWYLFDKVLLTDLVTGIISRYYEGLTGKRWQQEKFFFNLDLLIERMVEEMAVDQHMIEKLRTRDQKEMSYSEFQEILRNSDYSEYDIGRFKQGEKDIDIMTGPHLGEFNGEIALPELVDFIRKVAILFTMHAFIHSSSHVGKRPGSLPAKPKENITLFKGTKQLRELHIDNIRHCSTP